VIDYSKVCFVIMPFGTKKVGKARIDFDAIYDQVFVPAIKRVCLDAGARLEPRRTDKDFFSGDINNEMHSYIAYSRFAIADISGLNPNVFYELGIRHQMHESGTAIFRQGEAPIPFDIRTIKIFSYDFGTPGKVKAARASIARVLPTRSPPICSTVRSASCSTASSSRGPRCRSYSRRPRAPFNLTLIGRLRSTGRR
jgi:hypothetical protein